MFAQQRTRRSLAFGCEVAVSRVVASGALGPPSVGLLEDGEGKAGEAVHVHIAGYPCGNYDGTVSGQFHVWQGDVLVALCFIDGHRGHFRHGVSDTLDTIVTVGIVCARREFSHA